MPQKPSLTCSPCVIALLALLTMTFDHLTRSSSMAQNVAMNMDRKPHEDMYFTAPAAEREEVRIIGDDRFRDDPIIVSSKPTRDGTYMVIEGDMILGKREDILRDNLSQLKEEANLLNLSDPAITQTLTPKQFEVINILRRLETPDQQMQRELNRAVAQARVSPLVARVTSLVRTVGSKSRLIPKNLVDAVNQIPSSLSSTVVGARFRWPEGIIPYFYDSSTISAFLRQNIEDAVAHWNRTTDRIRLRPTREEDPYWIEFVPSTGCASFVGKVVSSGAQQIELADGCLFDQVVHEIGHAVGLFHEQTRNDRGKFLTIQIQNAIDGTASNFQLPLRGQAQDIGPFDFASVMLYAEDAFTANGLPTMVVKEPFRAQVGTSWGINRRGQVGLKGLSKGDVAGVAAMYPSPAGDTNMDLSKFVNTQSAPALPPRTPGMQRPQQPQQPLQPQVPRSEVEGAGTPLQQGAEPVRPRTPSSGESVPKADEPKTPAPPDVPKNER